MIGIYTWMIKATFDVTLGIVTEAPDKIMRWVGGAMPVGGNESQQMARSVGQEGDQHASQTQGTLGSGTSGYMTDRKERMNKMGADSTDISGGGGD